MQANFNPTGWLADVIGSKTYVDFSINNFNESFQSLLSRILHGETEKCVKKEENMEENVGKRPIDWDVEDVREWLSSLDDVDFNLMMLLSAYDGKMLSALNDSRFTKPDYYFKIISDHNRISESSVVKFTAELEKLFPILKK